MADPIILTAARLREILHYDPETGEFRWIEAQQGREAKVGWIQTKNNGQYLCHWVGINYKHYAIHRLAWLWMTGEWPIQMIDHINRNPLDNRWSNLRLATHSLNGRNARVRRDNKSGVTGLCWNKQCKKWQVTLICDTKEQAMLILRSHRKDFGLIEDIPQMRKVANQC